jgi:hypothetical protein
MLDVFEGGRSREAHHAVLGRYDLAENVFWVRKEARWSHLQDNAKQPTIGKLIDDGMSEIEKSNTGLKGVLPKDYNRPAPRQGDAGRIDRPCVRDRDGRAISWRMPLRSCAARQ